ncbi:Pol polyprotein [Plakobranchus ocellatus]|uniref:Pol polyprotein n=1 Tax=Plakobranchus ocellatus TaxID=259542 RepID=A0AAV4B4S9_9GAST|nr:Pol polyprotein [Plakobranchus ocellatus]
MAAFDFSIEYVPGTANRDADGLSRMPFETMDIATVQATCHLISTPLAHCHMMDKEYEASSSFPYISLQKLRQAQNTDEILGVWMTALRLKRLPRLNNAPEVAKHRIMKRNFAKLFLRREVMYRRTASGEQLVLPQCYVTLVCQSLHDESGHPGYQKTLALVQERLFWPRMT